MNITLPFRTDDLPDIVSGLLVSVMLLHLQIFAVQLSITAGSGDGMSGMDILKSMSLEDRRKVFLEALEMVAIGMPESIAERLRSNADAIAEQVVKADVFN
jgi:hypothetical protein